MATNSAAGRALAEEIGRAGGVARAADIVERVIATARPVTRRELCRSVTTGNCAAGTGGAVPQYDMVLVGGGLANGLIALRLRTARPELRLLIVEAGTRLGADHTWSFHAADLEPEQRRWIEPLAAHSWPSYTGGVPGIAAQT